MEWLTKEQAVERFWFGESVMASWINLPLLVFLIHQALDLDGHDIGADRIWGEVILPPMQGDEGDHRMLPPTVVYLYYADWVAELGRLLGVDPDADIQPDWLAANPCTHTVVKAMASVAVKVSMAASKAYEQQHGHSMMEVFMASCETGENFDQTQARLSAQRQGLRVVK